MLQEEEQIKLKTNEKKGVNYKKEVVYMDNYKPIGIESEEKFTKLEMGEI